MIDPPPAPMLDTAIVGTRTGKSPTCSSELSTGRPRADHADIGAGATDIQRHQIGRGPIGILGRSGGTCDTGGGSRQQCHDRTFAQRGRQFGAAIRSRNARRQSEAALRQPGGQAIEIGLDDRTDRRVQRGQHAALVLARLRPDFAGKLQPQPQSMPRHDLARLLLVRRIAIAVDQADDGDIYARILQARAPPPPHPPRRAVRVRRRPDRCARAPRAPERAAPAVPDRRESNRIGCGIARRCNSNTSRNPAVVISPMRAPRRSINALVATVLLCV